MLQYILLNAEQDVANHLVEWLLGLFASFILLGVTIVFNKMSKTIDVLNKKIEDNKAECDKKNHDNEVLFNEIDKRVVILETGVLKDLEHLTKNFDQLNNSIERLNENFNILRTEMIEKRK